MTVTAATRAEVFRRDGMCIIAKVVDRSHVCRDRWGEEHRPDDLDRLTIEHVRRDPGGARSDDRLVAMCHRANDQHVGSSTENRALINAYLAGVHACEFTRGPSGAQLEDDDHRRSCPGCGRREPAA